MKKLYEVTNGFMGGSVVHVLIVAKSKDRAKELARKKFKEGEENRFKPRPNYWQNLESEVLFKDLTTEQVSEIRE